MPGAESIRSIAMFSVVVIQLLWRNTRVSDKGRAREDEKEDASLSGQKGKTMNRRLYKAAALLLATLLLAACGKAPETTEETTAFPTGSAAATEAPTEKEKETETGTATSQAALFDPDIRFSAVDQSGNAIDETVFQDYVITMINFWEPWCGPCVGEMPDLEKLNQDRKDLLILGVYSTQDGADKVLKQTGVTYPVITYDRVFDRYQTGYVPTTIFVDPAGHVIGAPYVGSRSYEDWNTIIKNMIGH